MKQRVSILSIIFIFLAGLLIVFVKARVPESLEKHGERKETTHPFLQVERVRDMNNELNNKQAPVDNKAKMDSTASSWDVVVLGRIDACWVCQWGPSPHVSYTQVLAGKVPGTQTRGELVLVELAEVLLPEGGTPVYRSQQEEICFLKKVVVPGYEDTDVYKVIDVMEATPENLATFLGR